MDTIHYIYTFISACKTETYKVLEIDLMNAWWMMILISFANKFHEKKMVLKSSLPCHFVVSFWILCFEPSCTFQKLIPLPWWIRCTKISKIISKIIFHVLLFQNYNNIRSDEIFRPWNLPLRLKFIMVKSFYLKMHHERTISFLQQKILDLWYDKLCFLYSLTYLYIFYLFER